MDEDDIVKEKRKSEKKNIKNSSESHSTSDAGMVLIPAHELQVENELTKALLVLNPESITPRQALEIIYDLRAKAQKKSC